MKNMALPMKFNLIENDKSNLQKCELWVMREGLNSNGSSFDLEGMERAKLTLENIPILAYVKKREDGENDFDEHNMEYDFERDEDGNLCINEYYLEVPIGVIPETNNYRLEKINGHNWVVVDGYIWKSYSNEGYEILKRDVEKSVSMEISIGRGEFVNNIYNIKDYTYHGVTILGSDVTPGISGAKVKMDFSHRDNTEFFKAVKDLNEMLKKELESEVNEVEDVKKKIVDDEDTIVEEKPSNQDESPTDAPTDESTDNPETKEEETNESVEEIVEEEVVVETEETVEETVVEVETDGEVQEEEEEIAEDFSCNITNIVGYINETISGITFEEDWCGEIFNSQKYYYEDILIDSQVAILCDVESYSYVGVNYTLNGDSVTLDFNSAKEYISTWREREVGQVGGLGLVSAYKKDIESKLDIIVSRFKEENEKLQKFKDEVEESKLREELVEISNEFNNLEESEAQVVIEKVLNKELAKEEFKKELFALVGMKTMADSIHKFNSKKTKLKVQTQHEENNDPYGGLIKK